MKQMFFSLLLCLFLLSCKKEVDAPVPDLSWDLFDAPAAEPLRVQSLQKLNGVYAVEAGTENFGNNAAAKWSYTVSGTDTVYHYSFFFGVDAAYMVLEGRRLDSTILLNGYWRKMVSAETGAVRLSIEKSAGATYLLQHDRILPEPVLITGVYGVGNGTPETPVSFRYSKPLFAGTPFQILAHRGGGRTADLLPASENSVEIIRLASRFGATGVELDVQLTKDGVPVVFHDATLNERVVQKSGLIGPLKNYTFDQLSTLVRLTNGERIPTLRQAMETVLTQTPLQFVWLDIKYEGSLLAIRTIQADYLQRAAVLNRPLEVIIGIPTEQALTNFKKLPNYQAIPSLVEYSVEEAAAVNARIWAPQWTLGLQIEEVDRQQALGRRVFTWTMDIQKNAEQYIREGRFDGILSNYPSIIAYSYYAR